MSQFEIHRENGAKLGNEGRWNEATIEYEKAITLNPNDISAKRGLAWTYWGKGDIQKAVTLYDEALKIDPNDPETLKYRDICVSKLN